MTPKILVIDDDRLIRAMYLDILHDHGFDAFEAVSRHEAITMLEKDGPWDVILLDEFLSGPGGPATAVELLLEIAKLAPEAYTIVMTAYARRELAEKAVRAGAYDYLAKDANFIDLLLPLRVRHAARAADERRFRGVGPAALEVELKKKWLETLAPAPTQQQKGRLLEETVHLLCRTLPGLNEVTLNRRGSAEEFDVVVQNNSNGPFLQKEGSVILVECKHWSKPVGAPELSLFRDKLKYRFNRVSLGILISLSGFTQEVVHKLEHSSSENLVVLLLDRDALQEWIDTSDRIKWLIKRLESAILRSSH